MRGRGDEARAPLRYPDFLGIGAQKAGKPWLHLALSRHPDLWLPPLKEIHYFNFADLRRPGTPAWSTRQSDLVAKATNAIARIKWDKKIGHTARRERLAVLRLLKNRRLTDEWYGRIFRAAPDRAKCGEITPGYALLPDRGFEHVLRLNPEMKFFIVLRDPIDRGWSQLRMTRKTKSVSSVYEREVLRILDSRDFFSRSDYATTIERLRKFVPAERLLILYFDDLVADPVAFLKIACTFIGVDPARAPSGRLEPRYVGEEEELTPALYGRLRELLRPAYGRLEELGGPAVARWIKRHYGGTL